MKSYLGVIFFWGAISISSVAAFTGETERRNLKQSDDIKVELNKSYIQYLKADATRISIANPEIADVTLITPRQILIVSKARVGVTNLIVWYKDDEAEAYDVEVYISSHLLNSIKEAFKTHVPDAKIKPSLTSRTLILDGVVDDQETLERVLKIAGSYSTGVTNLIRVRSTIQKAIQDALPKNTKSKLTVNMTSKGISLNGTVSSQEEMLQALSAARTFSPNVTNLIRIKGPQQVQLEVTIAEVSRSSLKQMGLNYLTSSTNGRLGLMSSGAVSDTSSSGTSSTSSNSSSDVSVNVDVSNSQSATSDSSSSSGSNGMFDSVKNAWTGQALSVMEDAAISSSYGSAFQVLLQSMGKDRLAVISLLKGQGLARTLATPTLVTLTGQKAEFLVGGEIPYVTDEQILFREFGIQLKFTPFVIGEETITLKVEPEVSTPDWSFSPPGLKRRSGSTTLQLKDGQTFVMAGLLTEELSKITNKVPMLGDLPILGTLFTSKQFRKSESELVIIVTPKLVRPLNPGEVPPLPGANIRTSASDVRFFLNNDSDFPGIRKGGTVQQNAGRCGKVGFSE